MPYSYGSSRRDFLDWVISLLALYLFFWSFLYFMKNSMDPLIAAAVLAAELFIAAHYFPERRRSRWSF